jgi:sugar phosphate isomerase/epimerase
MHTAVQLGINGYGVLGRLPEHDLPAALDLLEDNGGHAVEVMSNLAADPASVSTLVDRRATVAAVHLFVHEISTGGDRRRWADTLNELTCPNLVLSGSGMEQTAGGYRELARTVSDLIEEPTPNGPTVYYHCHDSELEPLDGRQLRGVDILVAEVTGLRLVIDTYWAMAAGLDPAAEIARHRDRSGYYHLKDGTTSGGTQFGHGDLDVASTLAAAFEGPVDWVVLEQDTPSPDPAALFTRFSALVSGYSTGGQP